MSKHYMEQWHVHSFTTDDEYKVSVDDYRSYSCSCNAWIFQRGYPKPTEKRPHPVMRALHNGELRLKEDLDRQGIIPNGHCKHIMFIRNQRTAISTAVTNRSTTRIGDQASGFYLEVVEGRIESFLANLGYDKKKPTGVGR